MAVAVISAVAVSLLSAVVAESGTECVLTLPTNGSRDIYCDVIPYKIDLSRTNNMTRLDVSGNGLDRIYVTSDRNVTLPTLDLSGNDIQDVCQVITGGAVTVHSVILSYNKIKNFSMCTDARNLTLRWNRIESLRRADTTNASSLEVLDLGNNFILWIENDTFAGMPDLQWLDLKGNALSRISENTLPSATLRYLDVSENYGLDRSTAFQPFENLVELNVARNAELAPTVVLGPGPRLRALDASYTNLTAVPVTPAPLLGSLVLSGNVITAVNSGDLDGYPLLRLLNISHNRIAAVEDDAFGRLDLLTVLDLSDNALIAVPKSLPESLETLNLEGNRIQRLGAEDFEGCRRLKTLNVRDNGLLRIQDFALTPLLFLDVLDVSENPIRMITREMLTGPVRLRVLKLEWLTAPDTPAFPFTDTRYLNRVHLAHSPRLAEVLLNDTAVLSSVFQLEYLDLTGCAVTALPARLPYHAPKLRTLMTDELECPGPPWLRDWLCEIHASAERDQDRQPAETELRLRNRREPAALSVGSSMDGVRCARDDGRRTRQDVFDERYCAAIATTTETTAKTTETTAKTTETTAKTTETTAKTTETTGKTTEMTAKTTETTETTSAFKTTRAEQVAVFARLRAKDEAKNGSSARDTVVSAAHPGMIVFASVVLLLVALACVTVWIGIRGDALKRLHWKQNAADVDYQSIEIKSLESLNHVERW